jgi:hypothetical protein
MRIVAAVLLVVVPVAFNLAFFALQRSFDYPDILRRPTDEVLRRFHAGGSSLRLTWYAFALTALLMTPVAVVVHQLFFPNPPGFLAIGTVFGVLAGLVQAIGLLRWPFAVSFLAETYVAPDATPAQRETVAVVFQTLHRYAGGAIGENLGYLFTVVWTAIVCTAIIVTGAISAWLGWVGLVPAAAIFIGMFEEAGFKPAAAVSAIGYVLWSLWLVAFGISLFFAG